MSKRLLHSCVFSAAALAAAPASAGEWSFGAGADYSVGDYGQAEDTTIIEVPFTAAYAGDHWGVSFTAPYVHIDGPGGVAPGGFGGASSGGLLGSLIGDGQTSVAPSSGHVEESGLGDVVASASVTPIETDGGVTVSLIGGLSLPTGDEAKSLGAGETTGAVSGAVRKSFDDGAGLFGALGYQRGFESGADGVFAAAGAEMRVSDHVIFGGRVNWSEASSELRRESLQAGLYAGVDVGAHARLSAYASAGLSDTSPNAAGLSLTFRS